MRSEHLATMCSETQQNDPVCSLLSVSLILPSSCHCIVVTQGRVSATGNHHHWSNSSPVVMSPVVCYRHSLPHSPKNDKKLKSVPQSISLFSAKQDVGRRKEGLEKNRKMEKKVVNVTEP